MTKFVSLPANLVDLATHRSRRRAADDAAIYEIAYELHIALGDDVDDVTFADMVDAIAGASV